MFFISVRYYNRGPYSSIDSTPDPDFAEQQIIWLSTNITENALVYILMFIDIINNQFISYIYLKILKRSNKRQAWRNICYRMCMRWNRKTPVVSGANVSHSRAQKRTTWCHLRTEQAWSSRETNDVAINKKKLLEMNSNGLTAAETIVN